MSQRADENPPLAGKKRPVDRTETIPERKRSGSGRSGSIDGSGNGNAPVAAERAPSQPPGPNADIGAAQDVGGLADIDADEAGLPTDDPNRYELAGEHARGGLGRILRARDGRLGRTVAVKELIERTPDNESRFVREALITARLQHPGIVPVHEAGRWPSGDPYYVMKLISGQSLKELITAGRTLGERMSLLPNVIAVAEAIGYAHSQAVIHRDIKPSNIVVGEFGETVVVDWGLAKDLRAPDGHDERAGSLASSPEIEAGTTADVIGTPAYMPPEQASGDDVDERADVYAIGAVLYHTLTGDPPYAGESSGDIVSRVLGGPPIPVDHKQPGLPEDLVAIVDKAMAREPRARYRTARELVEDLKRFQTGKLVTAHDYSAWTLVQRWVSRHRAAVGVAVIGVAILGVTGVLAVNRIIGERNVAQRERTQAQSAQRSTEERRNALLFLQAQTSLDRDPTAAIAWLKQYPHDGPQYRAIPGMIDRARALGVARHVFRHDDWVYEVAFSPDGKLVASASKDGTVRAWDLATGRGRVLVNKDVPVRTLEFSPDGTKIAVGDYQGTVQLVSVRGGDTIELRDHDAAIVQLWFTPDGARLISRAEQGQVRIWPVGGSGATEPERRIDWQKGVTAPVLSANGRYYVTANDEGIGRVTATESANSHIWKTAVPDKRPQAAGVTDDGGTVITVGSDGAVYRGRSSEQEWKRLGMHEGSVEHVVFSPSNQLAATAGADGAIRIWDLSGERHRVLRGHTDAIYRVAFSPDEAVLVSASDDGTARLWDLRTGTARELRGHDDDVYRARISPDGSLVATASLDGTVRVWPTRFDESRILVGHDAGYVGNLGFVGGGDREQPEQLITQAVGETARVWDLDTGDSRVLGSPWPGRGFPQWHLVRQAEISESGLVGAAREDGGVEVLSVRGSNARRLGETGTQALAFARDGTAVIVADTSGAVTWYQLTTGAARVIVEATKGDDPASMPRVAELVVSPDGKQVAIIADDGVRLWDSTRGTITASPANPSARWYRGRFSPDGSTLAVISRQGSFALWDHSRTGKMRDFFADRHHIVDLSFSPDGRLVAAAVADRSIRVWDLEHDRPPHILSGHTDLVYQVEFSPDGEVLASSSNDRTVRLWKRGTWESRVLHGHAASVDAIDFSSDGSLLASMGRDGTVRLWKPEIELDPPPAEIESRLSNITSAVIGADDRPQTAQ